METFLLNLVIFFFKIMARKKVRIDNPPDMNNNGIPTRRLNRLPAPGSIDADIKFIPPKIAIKTGIT